MQTPQAKVMLAVAGLLFVAVPALKLLAPGDDSEYFRRSQSIAHVEARNRSAFAVILGEFRTNMGDIIWLKTERYLDSGIAYAPHIDVTQLESTGQTGHEGHDHDHDHDHDHEGESDDDDETSVSVDRAVASPMMREAATIKPGDAKAEDHYHDLVPTIIRTADEDFRGWIGNMEREVKPWRDPSLPHQHTAGTELLPWYRVGTFSDPKNVRMYIIGAWWLKTLRTDKQREEALKFLNEGLENNPGNFQIQYMRGYILRELNRASEAQQAFRDAATSGLKIRPKYWDGKSPEWDISKQEQLEGAMVMDVLYERDTHGQEKGLELATRYAEQIPGPSAVHRLEDNLAYAIYGRLE